MNLSQLNDNAERALLEAAIKRVQGAGYAVFKKEARLKLQAATLRPLEMAVALHTEGDYLRRVAYEHSRLIARNLVEADHIRTGMQIPTTEELNERGPWQAPAKIVSVFEFWSNRNKEWQR